MLSPSVATRLLGQVRVPAREPLSARELDVLALVARGTSNRDTAAVAVGFERGLLPRAVD